MYLLLWLSNIKPPDREAAPTEYFDHAEYDKYLWLAGSVAPLINKVYQTLYGDQTDFM